MTKLGCKGGHVQVKEKYIKYAYPGHGKFVGFKECPAKKCQGKFSAAK